MSAAAEIGLVPFARVAREAAESALPRARSKYSKHTCTQPGVLAILGVMRYEDWTQREAEVHLAQHQELRAALGLVGAVGYQTGETVVLGARPAPQAPPRDCGVATGAAGPAADGGTVSVA